MLWNKKRVNIICWRNPLSKRWLESGNTWPNQKSHTFPADSIDTTFTSTTKSCFKQIRPKGCNSNISYFIIFHEPGKHTKTAKVNTISWLNRRLGCSVTWSCHYHQYLSLALSRPCFIQHDFWYTSMTGKVKTSTRSGHPSKTAYTWIAAESTVKNYPSHELCIVSAQRKFNSNESNAACFFRPSALLIQLVTGFLLQGVVLKQYILDWLIP